MPPRKQPRKRGQALSVEDIRDLPAVVILAMAGKAWGLGRNAAYELNAAGEFPCDVLKLGERYKVRKSSIMTALGIGADGAPAAALPEPAAQPSQAVA